MSATTRKATKTPAPKSAYAKQLDRRRAKGAPPAEPTYFNWTEPDTFPEALKLHMHRHAESCRTLWSAIVQGNDRLHPATIRFWRNGSKTPRSASSMRYLNRIEARYSLPVGYFAAKLPHTGRARAREPIKSLSKAEQRRYAWHLPEDFNDLPCSTRQEILEWVRRVIITGTTEYRRYHAISVKQRFGLRFPDLTTNDRGDDEEEEINYVSHVDPDVHVGGRVAPPRLISEMRALLRFKTSTLTPPGYARRGAWGPETAVQKVEHLGLMLGALTAPTTHSVRGYGVELNQISLAHLVFPAVWDWYVQWRERRRGFYTMWEVDMLGLVAGLTSESTGWLTQTASLTELIVPLPDIVTASDVAEAKADWRGACARMHAHATMRAKEIARVSRVHRDPFEPILPVLEAPSPLREYRKIADEIERLTPDTALYPTAAAQARRALLIFRSACTLDCGRRTFDNCCSVRRARRTPRSASSSASSAENCVGLTATRSGKCSFRPARSRTRDRPSLAVNPSAYRCRRKIASTTRWKPTYGRIAPSS